MKVYARTPLDLDRKTVPHGEVFIIPERCKECGICIRFCPCQVLEVSAQTNSKGYHYPDIAAGKQSDCVHCEFCTLVCPEFAIYTLPAKGRLS